MAQQFQTRTPGLSLNSSAEEVIEELNYICGCNMLLNPCTRDEPKGSKEIKQFIQLLTCEAVEKSEVIERVVEKYVQAILKKKSL